MQYIESCIGEPTFMENKTTTFRIIKSVETRSLLTVDDRTGIVFEIVDDGEEDGVTSRHMAPRYILPEGDGLVDKGMKLEWATVKDGSLVLGSMGKEYTDNEGHVVNTNNNWVIFIDENGVISREDWTQYYT